jgi:hypothetical protein
MAIVKVDPTPFDHTNSVIIDSDAASNEKALHDIDDWAAKHGFARTNEYWLRVVTSGGKRCFRGFCYRLTEEEYRAAAQHVAEVREGAERLAPRRSA